MATQAHEATQSGVLAVRLTSLDVLRGATMALLCLQILRLPLGAAKFPDSELWQFISTQFSHASWTGMHLWDLIQPLFMFMVGVALPFSLANRRRNGETLTQAWRHVLVRSVALIAIGVMLTSLHSQRTEFMFMDVLSQIGLGYPILFALALTTWRTQMVAAAALLLLTWAIYLAYPAPDYAAHWTIHQNSGAAFDRWFMNLWPRSEPFVVHSGGYSTLNFLPSTVTMLLGLLCAELLRNAPTAGRALRALLSASALLLIAGLALDWSGICPSIKRLWTPSWVLISAGIIGFLAAAAYWLIDVKGHAKPFELLRILGLNSLILYVVLHLWDPFLTDLALTHLGWNLLSPLSEPAATFAARLVAYGLLLFFCVWLHRRRIYIRL